MAEDREPLRLNRYAYAMLDVVVLLAYWLGGGGWRRGYLYGAVYVGCGGARRMLKNAPRRAQR